MTKTTFAIIGTAGRGSDQLHLTKKHYWRMYNGVLALFDHLALSHKDIDLVSGGAAWADHLAVSLVMKGVIDAGNLTLFCPCDLTASGYFGTDEKSSKTANTANYYHKLFKGQTGVDGLKEIAWLKNTKANIYPGDGDFLVRNTLVANAVNCQGILLAFTTGSSRSKQAPWTVREFPPDWTGSQCGLKNGGTAHTWSLSKCKKFHGLIGYKA